MGIRQVSFSYIVKKQRFPNSNYKEGSKENASLITPPTLPFLPFPLYLYLSKNKSRARIKVFVTNTKHNDQFLIKIFYLTNFHSAGRQYNEKEQVFVKKIDIQHPLSTT